ncbi:hypothetical protein PRIPAC_73622, partial [Pristionchus pacificus]|uniref:Uncharacterized protein n=1 Tax=Pristionchus pacificus TaxID=54126 RepID=A0A2A6C0E7_PRIPA
MDIPYRWFSMAGPVPLRGSPAIAPPLPSSATPEGKRGDYDHLNTDHEMRTAHVLHHIAHRRDGQRR